MKRKGWMLIGLAALAPAAIGCKSGTTVETTRAASAPPEMAAATPAVTTPATATPAAPTPAAATPVVARTRSTVAAGEGPTKSVVKTIGVPAIVTHGHISHPKNARHAEPDPEKVVRFYRDRPDEFVLDGLTLTSPAPEPATGVPAPRLSEEVPAPPLTVPEPQGELPAVGLHRMGDLRLPRVAVKDVLHEYRDALQVCYATGTRADPWLPGTADLRFTIGRDGHVQHVAAHLDGLDRSPASRCMRNVVSKLDFAPPSRPVTVHERFDAAHGMSSGA